MVIALHTKKKGALVMHGNRKIKPVDWADYNRSILGNHGLDATDTASTSLEGMLRTLLIYQAVTQDFSSYSNSSRNREAIR